MDFEVCDNIVYQTYILPFSVITVINLASRSKLIRRRTDVLFQSRSPVTAGVLNQEAYGS